MIKFKANPVRKVRITSPYGMRKHPVTGKQVKHNGIDFGAETPGKDGDPLFAIDDGIVLINKVNNGGVKKGYGNYLVIQHSWGASLYGHMEHLSFLREGQKVKAGQKIGTMGSTGTSTSTHLHFGITQGDYNDLEWVDPAPYLIKEDDEMIKKIKIEINGAIKEIDAINKDGNNFVKLRDLSDAVNVDYDAKRNLPIVKSKGGSV